MGAASSVSAVSKDNSLSPSATVPFSDDEFKILVESFFKFYNHARKGMKKHRNVSHEYWNFDRFESIPIQDEILRNYHYTGNVHIEQKILSEYFRSVSTIHPLRVHQHLLEYIKSGILGINDNVENDNLLSIVNRNRDLIQLLISATESLNLVSADNSERICNSISITTSQEELLHSAITRLEGKFTSKEKEFLLENNSFPEHVYKFISFSLDGHHFETEARKILITYFLIFRGRLLPAVLSLKNEILDWAKKYDSDHAHDDSPVMSSSDPLPAPSAVVGVSLRFLKDFAASHSIPPEMTTAKVVSDIIVPHTTSLKETFINAHMISTPHLVSDLRKGYHKNRKVMIGLGNGMLSELDGFYCFLSHAWAMPFLELVNIANDAAHVHFKSQTNLLTHICKPEDILDCSFFWVDVFCKNQHIPAPAMDEFHTALKAPKVAVIALFPKEPIALHRIWCLFEIWTAVVNDIQILPTMSAEGFGYFSAATKARFDSRPKLRVPVPAGDSKTIEQRKIATEEFKAAFLEEMKEKMAVHVESSTATVPADIDAIMALIKQSTSVGQLNEDIFKAICDTLWVRIENEYGYSQVTLTIYF